MLFAPDGTRTGTGDFLSCGDSNVSPYGTQYWWDFMGDFIPGIWHLVRANLTGNEYDSFGKYATYPEVLIEPYYMDEDYSVVLEPSVPISVSPNPVPNNDTPLYVNFEAPCHEDGSPIYMIFAPDGTSDGTGQFFSCGIDPYGSQRGWWDFGGDYIPGAWHFVKANLTPSQYYSFGVSETYPEVLSESYYLGEDYSVILNPINHAPILNQIGNMGVSEGQTLTFIIGATDSDSADVLTYSATNLPEGATFDPVTRTFSWTPTYSQAGNYTDIEFTVTDNGSPMMLAFEDITITVGDVNRAPIFAFIGSQQVLEHNLLTFVVSASDPDGNEITLSASGMPSGATFNSVTGLFSWTPAYTQAGTYTPAFVAIDNGTPVASSTVDVVIEVGSNPTPTEQSQMIVDAIVTASISNNLENSYLSNLNKVASFIEQGKVQAAINQLNAFIQKVNQDYQQQKISLAERDAFVAQAQNLINRLQ